MDPTEDYSWKEEYKFGDTADMELRTLLELTRRGSTCTPKLIDWKHYRQSESDHVPNGFQNVYFDGENSWPESDEFR